MQMVGSHLLQYCDIKLVSISYEIIVSKTTK